MQVGPIGHFPAKLPKLQALVFEAIRVPVDRHELPVHAALYSLQLELQKIAQLLELHVGAGIGVGVGQALQLL